MECPSKDYLDSLCSNLALTRYQGKTDGCQAEDVADIVVHFTPEAVLRDPRYQAWVDRCVCVVICVVICAQSGIAVTPAIRGEIVSVVPP